MALISENHATIQEDSRKFWEDTLANTRINLFQLDKLIFDLTHDQRKCYSFDTGQNSINVSRQDLPMLIDWRDKLLKQIEDLEDKLGITNNSTVLPRRFPYGKTNR